jgi:hypothetical protein
MKLSAIHPAANETETAFKVYDHGADWQVIGKDFERWLSVWQHDKQGSLERALKTIPNFNPSAVLYIQDK